MDSGKSNKWKGYGDGLQKTGSPIKKIAENTSQIKRLRQNE